MKWRRRLSSQSIWLYSPPEIKRRISVRSAISLTVGLLSDISKRYSPVSSAGSWPRSWAKALRLLTRKLIIASGLSAFFQSSRWSAS